MRPVGLRAAYRGGVEILWWLAPAGVVTVLAMLWATWAGRPAASSATAPRRRTRGSPPRSPGSTRPPAVRAPIATPGPQHRHRRTPVAPRRRGHVRDQRRRGAVRRYPPAPRLALDERVIPMSRRTLASLVAAGLLVVLVVVAARSARCPMSRSPRGRPSTCWVSRTASRWCRWTAHADLSRRGRAAADDGVGDQPRPQGLPPRRARGVAETRTWRSCPTRRCTPSAPPPRRSAPSRQAQMVSSQDTAVAAALTEMGYDLATYAEVTGVNPGGPSEGKLEPRDRIVRARRRGDHRRRGRVRRHQRGSKPGDTVTVTVRRGGARAPVRHRDHSRPRTTPTGRCSGSWSAPATTSRSTCGIGINELDRRPQRRADLLAVGLRHPDPGLADRR